MKRIDIENLRDTIKSDYDINIDYDEYEQELMNDLEFGYITKDEFIKLLEEHYHDLEVLQLYEEFED